MNSLNSLHFKSKFYFRIKTDLSVSVESCVFSSAKKNEFINEKTRLIDAFVPGRERENSTSLRIFEYEIFSRVKF